MAEGAPGILPERRILRHWPWLVLSLVGAVVFGVLAAAAGYALARASTVTGLVIAGALALGLGVLAVYTLASLRTRTVLDRAGSTVVEPFSRRAVPWSRVTRLDVTHSLPGWAVRAWPPDGEPVVVYVCHDTHGRRPKTARTFERPPTEAPASLQRGFADIERFWLASSGSAG